jgi:small subunit ribosomal protein S17
MAEAVGKQTISKILKGRVVSTSMDKSAVIIVESRKRHPKYEKTIKRSKKYIIHDEKNVLNIGDLVTAREVRPLSKRKRFTLYKIVERAK